MNSSRNRPAPPRYKPPSTSRRPSYSSHQDPDYRKWLVIGAILLLPLLLFLGYRITTIAIGPVSVKLAPPTAPTTPTTAMRAPISATVTQTSSGSSGITNTPTPTPGFVDLNPELTLPFYDDFDNGLSPIWRVISGMPLVTDGRLTSATDELRLEIGNTALQNYTLEMDIWGEKSDYCGFGYWKYLTIGFSPKLRFQFSYVDYDGRLVWYTYTANEWKEIQSYNNLECGRLKIEVSGNSYRVSIQSELVSEMVAAPAQGPLYIGIDDSVTIDNLSIR